MVCIGYPLPLPYSTFMVKCILIGQFTLFCDMGIVGAIVDMPGVYYNLLDDTERHLRRDYSIQRAISMLDFEQLLPITI